MRHDGRMPVVKDAIHHLAQLVLAVGRKGPGPMNSKVGHGDENSQQRKRYSGVEMSCFRSNHAKSIVAVYPGANTCIGQRVPLPPLHGTTQGAGPSSGLAAGLGAAGPAAGLEAAALDATGTIPGPLR